MILCNLKIKTDNGIPIKSICRVETPSGFTWCCGLIFTALIPYTGKIITFDAFRYQLYSKHNELLKVKNIIESNKELILSQFDIDYIYDILSKELDKVEKFPYIS